MEVETNAAKIIRFEWEDIRLTEYSVSTENSAYLWTDAPSPSDELGFHRLKISRP